jgi:hypothetical protein
MNSITQLRLRSDSKQNWTQANPILQPGEPGFEIDTGNLKIGDGLKSWNDLSYIGTIDLQFITREDLDNYYTKVEVDELLNQIKTLINHQGEN